MRNMLFGVVAKATLIFFCFFIMLIASRENSFAQGQTTCPGDCDSLSSWNSPYATSISGDIGNCSFTVDYRYRTCIKNGIPIREVEILRINLINGGACDYVGEDVITRQAVKAILSHAHAIFGVVGGAPFNIKVRIPSCLKRAFQGWDWIISNGDCNEGCCTGEYTVRQDTTGFELVTWQSIPTDSVCNGGPTHGTCRSYCSNMDQPLNTHLIPFQWDSAFTCTGQCTNSWTWAKANLRDSSKNMEIYYAYRKCNTGGYHYELTVRRIELLKSYSWYSYEWIRLGILRAIHDLVHNVNFQMDPIFNDSTRMKVFSQPCWNETRKDTLYEPCFWVNCCFRNIWVRKDKPDDKHVVNQDSITSVFDTTYCATGCFYECRVLREIWTQAGPLPRVSWVEINEINNDPNSEIQKTDIGNIIIKPVPANNKIEFAFYSDVQGSLTMNLYDASGRQIDKLQYNKGPNEFRTEIDVSSYDNGVYFYELRINDHVLKGRFIVYK